MASIIRQADSSRPSEPTPARAAATSVAEALRQAGFKALFAGGCVRDRLMGIEPEDYDVVTDARPEQVQAIFPRAYGVGEAFGVMLVRLAGHVIEVATFRSDGAYTDSRRPDSVRFSDAPTDASRRDFTINGLFEDPVSGELIDYVGGRDDLKSRVIRAIGDPRQRFNEDRLRMIRAVRFAARFGFQIESQTQQAIREGASDLRGISRERVGHELRRMFAPGSRGIAARMLQEFGLDGSMLMEDPIRVDTPGLDSLPTATRFGASLAAWMIDRSGGKQKFYRDRLTVWNRALILSKTEQDICNSVLFVFDRLLHNWAARPLAERRRLLWAEGFSEAFEVACAVRSDLTMILKHDTDIIRTLGPLPPPLLTGDILLQAGFKSGPHFKQILSQVYDEQLEGCLTTIPEAIIRARSIVSR